MPRAETFIHTMPNPTHFNHVFEQKLYRMTMKRFQKLSWFGVGIKKEDSKHIPVHVNGKDNPCPSIFRDPKTRKPKIGKPMVMSHKHDRDHLQGVTPIFHVSRGDRRIALYGLDIDGDEPGDWLPAAKYGLRLLHTVLPDIEAFIEPGRSWPRKCGAYIWFRIDWQSTDPRERRRLERYLDRTLKRIAETMSPPNGCKFDALKGTTSYTEPNPRFDPEFAASESDHIHEVFKVDEHLWLPRHEARHYLKAQATEHGQKLTSAEANEIITDCPSRYEPMTRLQAYEAHQRFYKINNVKFIFQTELEKLRRHYGVLVTRPCWGAHSGQRPNNVQGFVAWSKCPAGQVTVAKLKKALAPYLDNTTPKPACSKQPKTKSYTKTLVCDPESFDALTKNRSDFDVMLDPFTENHLRMCAAVRIEMRRFSKLDPNAREMVIDRVVHWYETDGPATGHTAEEHQDRRERAGRIYDYFANTYDSTKRCGSGKLWIDDLRIIECHTRHTGYISDCLIRTTCGPDRPPTRLQIAAVYLIMMKGIATGHNRYVSYDSIRGLLSCLNRSMSNQMIAHCIRILIATGQLEKTKNHSHTRGSKSNHAIQYRLGARAYIPSWAEPDLPAEAVASRQAVTPPATGPKPGDTPALRLLTSPENSIKELGHWVPLSLAELQHANRSGKSREPPQWAYPTTQYSITTPCSRPAARPRAGSGNGWIFTTPSVRIRRCMDARPARRMMETR